MKTYVHKPQGLAALAKAFANALNSLFFSDDSREFQRLKNFIAS
ncbi:MAG: hypothetical protein U0T56_07440 [Ferruginibacter sp.]|jgi:hypothetical protein